ncbi:MAG: 2-C-methyl-D-erythritol 4-phosphate cytidylyltransferase, partial [Clostridiales bacterium]|nr:2-C-methyl-D-erythritol 4-phosphate cytidylyltransferase [Clostridiales bacterium]
MKSSDGTPDICALILCAGTGTRTGLPYNKILYTLGKKPILQTTLDAFAQSCVTRIVLAVQPCDEQAVRELAAPYKNVTIATGGNTRTQSVRNGLRAAKGCDIVAIHDGARPFVTPALINATVQSAQAYGSGIAAVPAVDTIKEAHDGAITKSLPREDLWCMQTPQTFSYLLICQAYEQIAGDYTDDAEVFLRAGHIPRIVRGEYDNTKVTTPSDLLRGSPAHTKIGTGFDVHPLSAERKLILGGVEIAHDKGLLGHSDGDVLTHAIMDALLSAAGLA